MKDIISTTKKDAQSGDAVYFYVRVQDKYIHLCISEEHGGEVDLSLQSADCREMIDWLEDALQNLSES